MKNLFTFILLFMALQLSAQKLKFQFDGTFKIAQFTDVHYIAGREPSKSSLQMIEATLDAEKPNLVVFTGDAVVGNPIQKGWDELLAPIISRKIPYLITLGNHDDEGEWKRNTIAEYLVSKPYILNKTSSVDGVAGFLNQSLAIASRNNGDAAVLYALDSRAYSTHPHVKGYGWFDHSQVAWFKRESEKYKMNTKDTLPALAFFHIPLPEYNTAFNDMKNKRIGVRYELECAPAINTGMFAAFLESGDVMGTFVGHDHVNDYLVEYNGIALTYGCFSGSANSYQRAKHGARIIKLFEGVRKFETYIREFDGEIVQSASYPFVKKK